MGCMLTDPVQQVRTCFEHCDMQCMAQHGRCMLTAGLSSSAHEVHSLSLTGLDLDLLNTNGLHLRVARCGLAIWLDRPESQLQLTVVLAGHVQLGRERLRGVVVAPAGAY